MKKIKLILLDVDGTLTDNKIIIGSDGHEYKNFNAKDGMAISQALNSGIGIGILTGRQSNIVELRASELGISDVFQGLKVKKNKVKELAETKGLSLDEIAFIGDDINDLEPMEMVGFRGCPSDAALEIKEISDFISSFEGGNGAVREIVEQILREQNKWGKSLTKLNDINQ